MVLNIILAVAGFVLLIKCADFFVDGAASFARNLKIPTAVIGLTIVAFGSSAPELAVSFNSHLAGNADMMFGNVIGSSIANIFVILGLAVLISPFKIENAVIKKEIPILILITLALSVLFLDTFLNTSASGLQPGVNSLSRADGIILILFFSIFVFYLITVLSNKTNNDDLDEKPKYKIFKSIIFIVFGLAGIIIGSELVVRNVAEFARLIGISQKIISVTIVSIGTSLPELVTTVVAAKKGENRIAIGNIVGSNIFNICIVLGLPVVILGEVATTAFNAIDILFMLLAVVLLWIFTVTDRKLKRYEGVIFITMYCMYGAYIFLQ